VRTADGGFALAESSMWWKCFGECWFGIFQRDLDGHGGFAGNQMSQMGSVTIAIEDASRRGKGTPWE
jgi:hypothetical protein